MKTGTIGGKKQVGIHQFGQKMRTIKGKKQILAVRFFMQCMAFLEHI